ncbi:maltose ABC transporter substrate-binding protein [Xylanimonas sp. McL0601]|uniref:sugar ABC transporter substrate-binding protein n=1 Tax=Xylanimonas sp. McL0601 TaxID=3414739 RepID=UPI003CF44FB1
MLRKIFAGGMVAALAVALTACATQNPTVEDVKANASASSDALDTKTPIELKVWESLLGPDDFIKQAGEKFTEKYPNITIKFVNVEVGDASKQIALDGPAGKGPDVFAAPHDTLGDLVSGGHVLPTEDVDGVKKNVVESAVAADTWTDGKMYGYPVDADTYAMYYNKDLVQEAPKSYDDLVSFATDFNSKNPGKYGFVMDVGNFYYTSAFMTGGDNRLFGAQGLDETAPNIDSDAAVQGYTSFQKIHDILPVKAADMNTATADSLFAAGKAAIEVSGPWNVKQFTDKGVNFGVAPMFSLPGESSPATSFTGVRTMFVSAYSEHPKEAAAFAEFLTTPEMQQLRADICGTLGVSSSQLIYKNDVIAGFSEQMKTTFAMPKIARMAKVWDALNAASANIWDGKDVKTELGNAQKAVLAN